MKYHNLSSYEILTALLVVVRFCVSVYRQHFPVELSVTGTSQHGIIYDQPGHVISVTPPLRVENLLPIELSFYLKENSMRAVVKPGDVARVVNVSHSPPCLKKRTQSIDPLTTIAYIHSV